MNALGDTSARARPWASNCRNPKNVVSSGGAMKAPPTPKNRHTANDPHGGYPAPGSPPPPPNPRTATPRPISDGPGSGGEKDSEGEPQEMGVEAGRETGCRIGRNQSRPGDGRRHAQINAEAPPISR